MSLDSEDKNINFIFDMKKELVSLLRSPQELKPLSFIKNKLITEDGEIYPIIDGIICLLKENQSKSDLGDDKFYDSNPFGLRDWSNPIEVEAGVENDLKKLVKRYSKNALIADVGAGTGRISNYLSNHGYRNVISLDYSLLSLKEVKNYSRNLCIWGNNLFLPIASNSFDLVISTGVIHHTPDPSKALEECARILKPGGKLYLKTRNIHSPYGYLFFTYGALLRLFESSEKTIFLSDLLGFRLYKLTRKILYSYLPKRNDQILRGKYANLFTKNLISFFTTKQVKQMLLKSGLEIAYGRKVGFTHRQHFYIAKKTSREFIH